MTTKDLQDFFVKQWNRFIDLEQTLENGGGSYWSLTCKTTIPYKTNYYLLKKIDLEEVFDAIPTPLKIDLDLFYKYKIGLITFEEMLREAKKPPTFFWICVNYACLLFYNNFMIKYKFNKEV